MTLESTLWQHFKRDWPGWADRFDTRMKSGVPDVHWLLDTGDRHLAGWIELKVIKSTSAGLFVPTLKLDQCIWLNRYAKAGGRCCIVTIQSIGRAVHVYSVLRCDYRELHKKPIDIHRHQAWVGQSMKDPVFAACAAGAPEWIA